MPDDRTPDDPTPTPDDADPRVGKRDLDYGHAFGTQRDRSEGGPADYLDDTSDDWQDAVPTERERAGGRPQAPADDDGDDDGDDEGDEGDERG